MESEEKRVNGLPDGKWSPLPMDIRNIERLENALQAQ